MPVVERQHQIIPSASVNVLICPVFSSTEDNLGFHFTSCPHLVLAADE